MQPGDLSAIRDAVHDEVTRAVRSELAPVLVWQEHVSEEVADHEERLRATERWRYTVPSSLLIAVLAAAASLSG